MKNSQSQLFANRFIRFSKINSLLVVLIGILVTIGWIFDIQELQSVFYGFQTMKVNTAIVFILSGVTLWLIDQEGRVIFYIKQIGGVIVLLIGLFTLCQYLFNINLGIDQLLFTDLKIPSEAFPGRMSFASALCSTLIGFALLFLTSPQKKVRVISQYPSAVVLTISFLALIGYVYDVQALYAINEYSTMGLHTAATFILSSLTILWVKPHEGWTKMMVAESAGGVVLRRLLPPLLLVPLLLSWLVLVGEKIGLYETHFGLAIISVLILGFLIVILFVNSRQINFVDKKRKVAEERYRHVLDYMMEGAQIIGFDWRYLYVNDSVAKQGNQTKENLLGRTMMEIYPGIENTELFSILKLCMQERMPHVMENEFTYPEGKKGWFELSIQPVEEGLFILSNEITERKHNEEALLRLNAELEIRIFERTAHLNLTNERLQNELYKREQAEAIILHQNKMLSDLHEITLDLLKQKSLDQLLNRVVEISAEFLDAPYVSIALFDGEILVVKATTQNQSKMLGQRLGRNDAKLSWQAFDSRKTAVLQDYSTWMYRRKEHEDLPHYAVADFPILNGEECLGVLGLGRDKTNYEFSEEQIQIGNLFASMAALVLDNAQLRETLREQSIHDSLTGLFNRRYMEETLIQEISRAARQNHQVGIIMLDIDHFKIFNDTYGHVTGDTLLSELGKFLKTNIRTEDTACRYGGEEFLLILPNLQLEVIQQRAEFLLQGVIKLQVFDNEKTFAGITISAGIAIYPQHGPNIEDLIRSADKALYQAKQNGRNCVEVAK